MTRLTCWLLLAVLQFAGLQCQDLKSIFHIPSKRNYDDLEILERSNFGGDPAFAAAPSAGAETPRPFANAQVMVRFGGDSEKGRCPCGERCQCRCNPYYVPVIAPLPYHWCNPYMYMPMPPPYPHPYPVTPPITDVENVSPAPPLPPLAGPPRIQFKGTTNNYNVPKEEMNNSHHPEILKTVELSEVIDKTTTNRVTTEEDAKTVRLLEEVSKKLYRKEPSAKVKFVDMDIVVPDPPKKQLKECLVPYRSPKMPQPKLMVTYPIFNRPREIEAPPMMQYVSQNGYSVSGGSGYYSDPAGTVVYNEPTMVSVIPPQANVITAGGPHNRVILGPMVVPPSTRHYEDCYCPSCAKYSGELNQKEMVV